MEEKKLGREEINGKGDIEVLSKTCEGWKAQNKERKRVYVEINKTMGAENIRRNNEKTRSCEVTGKKR